MPILALQRSVGQPDRSVCVFHKFSASSGGFLHTFRLNSLPGILALQASPAQHATPDDQAAHFYMHFKPASSLCAPSAYFPGIRAVATAASASSPLSKKAVSIKWSI